MGNKRNEQEHDDVVSPSKLRSGLILSGLNNVISHDNLGSNSGPSTATRIEQSAGELQPQVNQVTNPHFSSAADNTDIDLRNVITMLLEQNKVLMTRLLQD